MTTNTIAVQGGNITTKNFIIGKLWSRSRDGQRPGVLRINRDLPQALTIHAGATMILHENNKREGKQDADYSVSVILPTDQANKLISAQRQLFAARQQVAEKEEEIASFAV